MIYICVPVHNEQRTVGLLLWQIRKLLTELGRDFRILVLDDGSTDATREVLEPYQRVIPLTVFDNSSRHGYAASLERLIREAVTRSDYPKRDAVLTLQADFSEAPEVIPDMIRLFEGGADLVVGRRLPDRGLPRPVRLARAAGALLARGLPTPAEVEDPLCGFRLYRLMTLKRALAELDGEEKLLHHDGWAANAELLVASWPYVRRVEHVDLTFDYRRHPRTTRVRPARQLWGVLRAGRDPRLRRLAAVLPGDD